MVRKRRFVCRMGHTFCWVPQSTPPATQSRSRHSDAVFPDVLCQSGSGEPVVGLTEGLVGFRRNQSSLSFGQRLPHELAVPGMIAARRIGYTVIPEELFLQLYLLTHVHDILFRVFSV